MSGFRPTRNADPSRFFPASGASITLTAPIDASWSAYADGILSADSGGECVLSTINVECLHAPTPSAAAAHILLELNVGAAGYEAPIGAWWDTNIVNSVNMRYQRQFRLNGYKLAANSRLTARVRLYAAVANGDFRLTPVVAAPPSPVLFSPYAWDEDAYIQGGVSLVELIPATTTTAAVCGAADTWGNPVEFIASAGNRLLVFGVVIRSTTGGSPPQPSRVAVQVGIGAASSEVWHETVPFGCYGDTGFVNGTYELPRPVEVLPGDRVAVRAQGNVASKNVNTALILGNLNF
jgi:hypothetical protein